MQVKEVMTSGVECISPDTTLRETAQKMKELDVGALPICGDDDRLAGIVTDRDIAVRAVADGLERGLEFGLRDPFVMGLEGGLVSPAFHNHEAIGAARLLQDGELQIRALAAGSVAKFLDEFDPLGDRIGPDVEIRHGINLSGPAPRGQRR